MSIVTQLRNILGAYAVVSEAEALSVYDADASMIVSHPPEVVALPATPHEAAAAVRLAAAAGMPVVARGAGTGIAGGAIPIRGGMVLSTARMERIEAIEPRSRRALVEAGVVNAELNARLAPLGLQFAPDPSSQRASTIGGNLATNAGGPHCLKYGVTTNHVLALELVRSDGSLLWTGDGTPDAAGYDLTGLVVGSEGTFGVITRAILRLTPLPEANRVALTLFPNVVAASSAVSAIIASGLLPTSLEVMDHNGIRAVNRAYGLGLPETGETTLLIIEVDGVEEGLDETLDDILALCRKHGAFEVRPARTPEEQARVWAARKAFAGAVGRLAPAYLLIDTVVPRTRLPLMMEHVERLRHASGMEICNVFHAGDGNLHPLVLYNPRDPDQRERAHTIARSVLFASIEQGGVISGEHGIGVEKQEYLPLLFSRHELQLHAAVYACFNPDDRFNPGKIFPASLPPLDLAAERRARIRSTAASARPTDDTACEASTSFIHTDGAVAAPSSLDELAQITAACHRAGISIVPTGWPDTPWHRPLPPSARRIAVRNLRRVLMYEPDDQTIGVEAGMTLAELQTLLADHRQMLPLDLHAPERATLGGLVATAADGPRRLGYGILRDWVLGLTVVEADGVVVHLGRQVVKNVSGFDLVKLFVGSHGTLGIIAAVRMRVFPQPPATATLAITFASLTQAMTLLDAVAASRLQPTTAELVQNPPEDLGLPIAVPSGGALLALRAEGHPAAIARHRRELRTLATQAGALTTDVFSGSDETMLWASLVRLSAPPRDPAASLMRLCTAPADLGGALMTASAEARAYGLSLVLCARALSGIAYLHAAGPADARLAFHARLVQHLRHVHLLDPVLAARADHPWGAPPPALDLMRALKTELDPFGRMNPGALFWREGGEKNPEQYRSFL